MQFIVIAYDGYDDGALARRMAVREEHLKLGRELHAAGKWLYASGILDDVGNLIGSMIVCEFASREKLQQEWLGREVYIKGKVWKKIDIRRAQVASFCMAQP